jgi:hypothetical protein
MLNLKMLYIPVPQRGNQSRPTLLFALCLVYIRQVGFSTSKNEEDGLNMEHSLFCDAPGVTKLSF